MQCRIRVEVPLKATEDPDIILSLIDKIIVPERVYVEEAGTERVVIAEASNLSSLLKLHSMFRRERILDAARKRLKAGVRGNTIVFMLHKQALAAGRLSLVDAPSESPLGPVTVVIEHPRPQEVIDWLVPPTSRGKPLWERSIPSDK